MVLNIPTTEGIELGKHMARFADAEIDKAKAADPTFQERCETCAFRLGTYPNGCATTLMDAMKCMMEGDTDFLCHERGTLCRGFVALKKEGAPIKLPWDYTT